MGVGSDLIRISLGGEPREGELVVLLGDWKLRHIQRLFYQAALGLNEPVQVIEGVFCEAGFRHLHHQTIFIGSDLWPRIFFSGKARI